MADDRYTNFLVDYDLTDTSAVTDSTPTMTLNADFCTVDDIKTKDEYGSYLTLEHNFSVLDGSLEEFPDEPSGIPIFTSVKSNSSGYFDENPVLDLQFSKSHSSYAMILYFKDDYPLEINITWYTLKGSILYSGTYTITGNEFVVPDEIEMYGRIVVEFVRALPDRYIKLYYVKYGMVIHWDETNIENASLVMEEDKISNQLTTNKLTYTVIDDNNSLNLANYSGTHRFFQKSQQLLAYEELNGEKILLGKYFMDSFSESAHEGKMSCVSYMGILESIQFITGQVYTNGTTARTILTKIFDTCGIEDYEIDGNIASTVVYGALPPMTCKQALREVLFATGGIVDTTSSDHIQIYAPSILVSDTISRNTKISTKVTRKDYVHSVSISYNKYTVKEESEELINELYPVGIYTVTFDSPYTDLEISGGTIIAWSNFYVKFQVTEYGTVVINGTGYDSATLTATTTNTLLTAGETETTETYSSKLCNGALARTRANSILKFKQNRLELQIKQLAQNTQMDYKHIIENAVEGYDSYIGYYTSRSFDLTGGFVDNSKLVAYYNDSRKGTLYTGKDLYGGENGIF